jgi:hypothetical protein
MPSQSEIASLCRPDEPRKRFYGLWTTVRDRKAIAASGKRVMVLTSAPVVET